MKKIISLVLFLSLGTAPPFLCAAVNFAKGGPVGEPVPSVEPPSGRLIVGERLLFDVYWMGLPVGVGILEVREKILENGRWVYHVAAVARTNDVLSKIYPIYDEIHSKIDAEEFYSHEFRKILREGHYRADEKVVFDHRARKGFYESFLNQTKKEFDIRPRAQDFLSVFYWFRVQPAEAGQRLRTVISDKGRDYDVEIAVLGLRKKELKGGRVIWTLEVEPKTRYREVLCRRGRGWVDFTVDSARIPVLIRIQTPFGPVTGVLRP